MKISGVASFAAGKDGETLLVVMTDPDNTKVWIKSKDAWDFYASTKGLKKGPMCVFDPPTFKIMVEDGRSATWSATVERKRGEVTMSNLVRQTQN